MLGRTDKNPIAEWWWTVDRLLLVFILALMTTGVILSLAASPPVALRLGLSEYHFVIRHIIFIIPAIAILIGVSILSPQNIRRLAALVFIGALVLTFATLVIGMEAKGAKRWLYLGGFSLQPSEFLKPAFLVLAAWLFAEGTKRPDVPATLIACLLIVPVVTPLILQPDFGQTLLIAIAWAALFFMAGMPWGWIVLLGGVGIVGSVGAYFTMDHVARRIDRFLDPSSGDTYQVDRAIESFTSGGWFGRGPGEGIVKRALPDSHTDFIFAVAGEEFGAIFCLIVVAIFAAFVVRGLSRSYRASDAFLRLAPAGLCMLIGLQATINMAVNLSLVPAKGMTLPFISYGGSSMLSLAFAGGMILGLTRRRTDPIAVRSAHADRMFAESPAE